MVGTIAGILLAMLMNNGGGAWDNAKKFIETGQYGGKKLRGPQGRRRRRHRRRSLQGHRRPQPARAHQAAGDNHPGAGSAFRLSEQKHVLRPRPGVPSSTHGLILRQGGISSASETAFRSRQTRTIRSLTAVYIRHSAAKRPRLSRMKVLGQSRGDRWEPRRDGARILLALGRTVCHPKAQGKLPRSRLQSDRQGGRRRTPIYRSECQDVCSRRSTLKDIRA